MSCLEIMDADKDLISDFSRLYILMILYEGPEHGYGILSKYQKRVGKKISNGFVYPFLQQLEDKNLITVKSEMQGDREKKLYNLTPEGREFCSKLFTRFAELVAIAIQPRMDICAHCGCKMYEGGYNETINGQELVFCCVHCAGAYKEEQGLVAHKGGNHKHG